MKFKKLLLTLPVATMGAGLLATVLTSCSNSKIDDDKKITLNDDGKLTDNYGYRDAVKWALTRSTSWATFKEAMAEEIILKWYEDRMYEDTAAKKERNKTFKSNYDEWKYQINKDYDALVQSQKTKYGTNYKFYLQNEYLSQFGGTEETYKHAKLVEKVKTEFVNNVWKFNYFSYNGQTDQEAGTEVISAYPHIFTSGASTTVSRDELNKPENWSKIGFYASVNPSFSMKTWPKYIKDIDPNFLAKNPDGDYATIQNYVFNRYFKNEKPFFSAASLFKYSKPHGIEEGDKLNVIYSTSNTGVKLPDEPNESFPFFGGAEPTDATKGTRMFMEWFKAFDTGDFATSYESGEPGKTVKHYSNGTVSITNSGKTKYSEDSQTLLLVSSQQMLGGTDPLYVPYATAAAEMYANMLLGAKAPTNAKMNYTTQKYVDSIIPKDVFEAVKNNNPAILKNFFFTPYQYWLFLREGDATLQDPTRNTKLNSFLDLTRIYPDGLVNPTVRDGSTAEKAIEYHCPLFKNVKNFTYFYGDGEDTSASSAVKIGDKWYTKNSGLIYITNTMYINEFTPSKKSGINGQPWVLQLNQSGMHAQTIDGYDFIQNYSTTYGLPNTLTKSDAAKLVFKYRLMQKRTDQIDFMSGDLLGSSGKLKTYFSNNFADIILEMAQDASTSNVFRELSTFNEASLPAIESSTQYFFNKLCDEQKFGIADIKDYLNKVAIYDGHKKNIETVEKINNYIYDYRSKIIATAKSVSSMKTIYGNGLLAPLAYAYSSNSKLLVNHEYRMCDIVADIVIEDGKAPDYNAQITKDVLIEDKKAIEATKFFTDATSDSVKVNEDKPFSPQVKAAKDASSNRYWYKSSIVDKVMYAFNGTKTGLVNAIKYNTYNKYASEIIAADTTLKDIWSDMRGRGTQFYNAEVATYNKSKVITGNVTYADLGTKTDTYSDFLNKIQAKFKANLDYQNALNGDLTSDDALAKQLFEATLAYLCIDGFQNLYKALNSKIGENEVAVVGYVDKLNPWTLSEEEKKTYAQAVADDAGLIARYGFTPDVDNIFDQDGFAGGETSTSHTASKEASAQYWNIVAHNATALAGFTGIQSKSSNTFDSASDLQNAVFNKFAWSTQKTKSLKEGVTEAYGQNDGAWFAFAGEKETNGKDLITFDDITYTPESGPAVTFKAKQFQGDDSNTRARQILRLAKKIANYDSIDDLKTLSKSLADAYDGGSIFKQIGYGEITYQDVNQMRIQMLNALPHYNLNQDGSLGTFEAGKFENCFKRIEQVEVHTTTKLDENKDYCFDDGKGNGYHAFVTQVNKADITEKRLHWVWDKDTKKWTNPNNSPISADEFLYILCSTACEASVQSLVITQAIKKVYGDAKLKVYDASLYNAFDSAWIKDWVKKPIGK